MALLGWRVLQPIEPPQNVLRRDLGQRRRAEAEVPRNEALVVSERRGAIASLDLGEEFAQRLVEADDLRLRLRERAARQYAFCFGASGGKGTSG